MSAPLKPWTPITKSWPANGDNYWFRTTDQRQPPFVAKWDAAHQGAQFQPTSPDGSAPTVTLIPWLSLSAWRAL